MNIIFVPTVQHTGTWFVLRFLERFGYGIKEIWQVLEDGKIPIPNSTLLHTHFPVQDALSQDLKKASPLRTIFTLVNLFKTVVPVRDPLAAILTRECRHPEYHHFYIVDGFVNMAKLHGHPNVYFFPIDLEVEKRKEVLTGALAHCDISIDPYLISTVAEEWKPENPTPTNRFHDIYREKDWGKLESLLGPKVASVEYLRNKSAQIKPFLSALGYGDLWP